MQEYIKECLKPLYTLQCMKGKYVFSNKTWAFDPETSNTMLFYIALNDKRLMSQ